MKMHKEQMHWIEVLVKLLQGSIIPCCFIIIWDLSVRFGLIPNTLIATPIQVAVQFWAMFWNGSLFSNAWVSLLRLIAGFMVGTVLGITIGSIVGYSKTIAKFLEASLLVLIPVPPIAWIPLLIILLGIGESSKIALISIGSFCTLFLQVSNGIRSVNKDLVEVGYTLNKSNAEMFFNIFFPAIIPDIFSSMRVAMALSWTLLMASEIIASSSGLGWLVWDSRNFSRPDDMIVGMIAIGILGKASDYLLVVWGRYLTRWRSTYQDAQKFRN
jgi:ABC-type nitrate/sulfonate/bicarbonate transport system permease component